MDNFTAGRNDRLDLWLKIHPSPAPTHPSTITCRLMRSQSHGVNISEFPEPAEKRLANDGVWYTHAQFGSHYGDDAYWYWERAATQTASDVRGASHLAGRCEPQLLAASPPEPTATNYASDCARISGDCGPPLPTVPSPFLPQSHGVNISGVSQPAEKKLGNNGAWYTREQFAIYYGERINWYWERAAKQSAPDVSGRSHLAGGCEFQLHGVSPPQPTLID